MARTQNFSVSRTKFSIARILYPLRHKQGLFIFLKFRGSIKAQADTFVEACPPRPRPLGAAGNTPCNMFPFVLPTFKRIPETAKGSSGQTDFSDKSMIPFLQVSDTILVRIQLFWGVLGGRDEPLPPPRLRGTPCPNSPQEIRVPQSYALLSRGQSCLSHPRRLKVTHSPRLVLMSSPTPWSRAWTGVPKRKTSGDSERRERGTLSSSLRPRGLKAGPGLGVRSRGPATKLWPPRAGR